MIYTPLTIKALKLSYQAHEGQFDKAGVPYIYHPYHIAEQMENEYTVCAALLHDTVEDTFVTLNDLSGIFPSEIVRAVKLLTHEDHVPYIEYIRRIKSDPIAKAVKIADLRHNSDQTRFAGVKNVNENKLRQLREKYENALELLLAED